MIPSIIIGHNLIFLYHLRALRWSRSTFWPAFQCWKLCSVGLVHTVVTLSPLLARRGDRGLVSFIPHCLNAVFYQMPKYPFHTSWISSVSR